MSDTTGSNNLIFFFSGTGNNIAIAKKVKAELGGELIRITNKLLWSRQAYTADKCIIIYPSYGYGAPRLVHKFFHAAHIRADYIAILVSYGSAPGAAGIQIKKILEKKGRQADLYLSIRSVENFIPIFGLDEQKKHKSLIKHAEHTAAAIEMIRAGAKNKPRRFYPLGSMVSGILIWALPILNRMYKISDKCNGCGVCVRACPGGAMVQNARAKPEFVARGCELCQACLNLCPMRAISFVRLNAKSPRYLHPEVSAGELQADNEKRK